MDYNHGGLTDTGGFFDQLRQGAGVDRASVIAELFVLTQPDYGLESQVVLGCSGLLKEGKLSSDELAPHMDAIMAIWRSASATVEALRRSLSLRAMAHDAAYRESRYVAEISLELFGYLSFDEVGEILQDALTFTDDRIKLFAALSLMRHHKMVNADEIDRIAADNEVRIVLWRELSERGLQALMPAKWAVPEQLAASSLVSWAAFPTELGTPPEEIELMEAFPTDGDEGVLDVYLFRFREGLKPSEPGEGWMAGIAGPFYNGKELDCPWSAFDRWDTMSPTEHFSKLYWGKGK